MGSISEKRVNPSQTQQLKDNTSVAATMNVSGAQTFLQNALNYGQGQGPGHEHEREHGQEHGHGHGHEHGHGHGHGHSRGHGHGHSLHHTHHYSQQEKRHSGNYGHKHHHNHNHYYQHNAKENVSSGVGNRPGSGSGSGVAALSGSKLEILDFHESWLEEMQVYRDILHVKKNYPLQFLSSHNHLHTPQGSCQFDDGHKTKITRIAEVSHTNKTKITNTFRRNVDGKRKVLRTTREYKQRGSGGSTSSKEDKHTQLHLKRPRDHTPTTINDYNNNNNNKTSGHYHVAKRSNKCTNNVKKVTNVMTNGTTNAANNSNCIANKNHNTIQTTNAVHSTTISNNHYQNNSTYNSSMNNNTSSIISTKANSINSNVNASNMTTNNNNTNNNNNNKSKMRIIVNQFHASSLLNGHEFEEKAKILTQNGLTKSAASTAYEASFYAANYLTPSLNAKPTNSNNNRSGHADDDPCAAIDDVTTYTDTDSEEEYTGEPFFLDDDEKQTPLQSKNIREQISQESLVTNDTEKSQTSDYYRPKEILSPSLFPNVPPYLNFSSHADKGPSMPSQLHKVLKWKLSPVMPKIVKRVVLNSGFRIIKNTTDWMAIWEKHMKSPGFRTIRSHQKYNHMPGSFRIGRKDTMWRSIQHNMKKYGTKEFGFMQKSYVMPDDLESLRLAWPKNSAKLTKWIVKPPASARGTGIRIVNQWSQFPKDRPLVVQKYIERPLLVNDNKFDMRIYVVLTSINPLRLYLYKDGLARFASVKYSSELGSLDERCMHLTNYSINKFSQNYSKNEDFNACQGHKWTLQSLWSCLEARGVNTKRLWATLRNLVIKAIISGEAGLNRVYRQNVNFRYNCFELFGFDVLLDENLIPWLLEINISPSLHSELPLDLHVKGPLIQAVLNTALYQVPPKLSEKAQNEILEELKLQGPLCHDKRIFTTCLTAEEVRKHNQFTNRSVEFREEYLDNILENLLPDDVRCLVVSEDELARCKPLERIFPTAKTHTFLKFIENPRYYNRLLDAWEHRYGNCREKGIEILAKLCKDNYHLNVSDAALEKEPNVDVTEIDMLHLKKSDDDAMTTTTSAPLVPATTKQSDSDIQSQASNDDLPKDKDNKVQEAQDNKKETVSKKQTAQSQNQGRGDETAIKDDQNRPQNNVHLANATST